VQALSLILALGLCSKASLSVAAAATSVFKDTAAGLSFTVPFAEARFKSPGQIRQLLLQRPGVVLPQAAQFTSGIYSNTVSGLPYLLAWKVKQPSGVSQATLSSLAATGTLGAHTTSQGQPLINGWSFSQDLLRGTGSASFEGGLKARLMVQVLKSSVVYLGFFYQDETDAKLFDSVLDSVTLLGRKPHIAAAPTNVDSLLFGLAVFAFIAASSGVIYLRLRSRPPHKR